MQTTTKHQIRAVEAEHRRAVPPGPATMGDRGLGVAVFLLCLLAVILGLTLGADRRNVSRRRLFLPAVDKHKREGNTEVVIKHVDFEGAQEYHPVNWLVILAIVIAILLLILLYIIISRLSQPKIKYRRLHSASSSSGGNPAQAFTYIDLSNGEFPCSPVPGWKPPKHPCQRTHHGEQPRFAVQYQTTDVNTNAGGIDKGVYPQPVPRRISDVEHELPSADTCNKARFQPHPITRQAGSSGRVPRSPEETSSREEMDSPTGFEPPEKRLKPAEFQLPESTFESTILKEAREIQVHTHHPSVNVAVSSRRLLWATRASGLMHPDGGTLTGPRFSLPDEDTSLARRPQQETGPPVHQFPETGVPRPRMAHYFTYKPLSPGFPSMGSLGSSTPEGSTSAGELSSSPPATQKTAQESLVSAGQVQKEPETEVATQSKLPTQARSRSPLIPRLRRSLRKKRTPVLIRKPTVAPTPSGTRIAITKLFSPTRQVRPTSDIAGQEKKRPKPSASHRDMAHSEEVVPHPHRAEEIKRTGTTLPEGSRTTSAVAPQQPSTETPSQSATDARKPKQLFEEAVKVATSTPRSPRRGSRRSPPEKLSAAMLEWKPSQNAVIKPKEAVAVHESYAATEQKKPEVKPRLSDDLRRPSATRPESAGSQGESPLSAKDAALPGRPPCLDGPAPVHRPEGAIPKPTEETQLQEKFPDETLALPTPPVERPAQKPTRPSRTFEEPILMIAGLPTRKKPGDRSSTEPFSVDDAAKRYSTSDVLSETFTSTPSRGSISGQSEVSREKDLAAKIPSAPHVAPRSRSSFLTRLEAVDDSGPYYLQHELRPSIEYLPQQVPTRTPSVDASSGEEEAGPKMPQTAPALPSSEESPSTIEPFSPEDDLFDLEKRCDTLRPRSPDHPLPHKRVLEIAPREESFRWTKESPAEAPRICPVLKGSEELARTPAPRKRSADISIDVSTPGHDDTDTHPTTGPLPPPGRPVEEELGYRLSSVDERSLVTFPPPGPIAERRMDDSAPVVQERQSVSAEVTAKEILEQPIGGWYLLPASDKQLVPSHTLPGIVSERPKEYDIPKRIQELEETVEPAQQPTPRKRSASVSSDMPTPIRHRHTETRHATSPQRPLPESNGGSVSETPKTESEGERSSSPESENYPPSGKPQAVEGKPMAHLPLEESQGLASEREPPEALHEPSGDPVPLNLLSRFRDVEEQIIQLMEEPLAPRLKTSRAAAPSGPSAPAVTEDVIVPSYQQLLYPAEPAQQPTSRETSDDASTEVPTPTTHDDALTRPATGFKPSLPEPSGGSVLQTAALESEGKRRSSSEIEKYSPLGSPQIGSPQGGAQTSAEEHSLQEKPLPEAEGTHAEPSGLASGRATSKAPDESIDNSVPLNLLSRLGDVKGQITQPMEEPQTPQLKISHTTSPTEPLVPAVVEEVIVPSHQELLYPSEYSTLHTPETTASKSKDAEGVSKSPSGSPQRPTMSCAPGLRETPKQWQPKDIPRTKLGAELNVWPPKPKDGKRSRGPSIDEQRLVVFPPPGPIVERHMDESGLVQERQLMPVEGTARGIGEQPVEEQHPLPASDKQWVSSHTLPAEIAERPKGHAILRPIEGTPLQGKIPKEKLVLPSPPTERCPAEKPKRPSRTFDEPILTISRRSTREKLGDHSSTKPSTLGAAVRRYSTPDVPSEAFRSTPRKSSVSASQSNGSPEMEPAAGTPTAPYPAPRRKSSLTPVDAMVDSGPFYLEYEPRPSIDYLPQQVPAEVPSAHASSGEVGTDSKMPSTLPAFPSPERSPGTGELSSREDSLSDWDKEHGVIRAGSPDHLTPHERGVANEQPEEPSSLPKKSPDESLRYSPPKETEEPARRHTSRKGSADISAEATAPIRHDYAQTHPATSFERTLPELCGVQGVEAPATETEGKRRSSPESGKSSPFGTHQRSDPQNGAQTTVEERTSDKKHLPEAAVTQTESSEPVSERDASKAHELIDNSVPLNLPSKPGDVESQIIQPMGEPEAPQLKASHAASPTEPSGPAVVEEVVVPSHQELLYPSEPSTHQVRETTVGKGEDAKGTTKSSLGSPRRPTMVYVPELRRTSRQRQPKDVPQTKLGAEPKAWPPKPRQGQDSRRHSVDERALVPFPSPDRIVERQERQLVPVETTAKQTVERPAGGHPLAYEEKQVVPLHVPPASIAERPAAESLVSADQNQLDIKPPPAHPVEVMADKTSVPDTAGQLEKNSPPAHPGGGPADQAPVLAGKGQLAARKGYQAGIAEITSGKLPILAKGHPAAVKAHPAHPARIAEVMSGTPPVSAEGQLTALSRCPAEIAEITSVELVVPHKEDQLTEARPVEIAEHHVKEKPADARDWRSVPPQGHPTQIAGPHLEEKPVLPVSELIQQLVESLREISTEGKYSPPIPHELGQVQGTVPNTEREIGSAPPVRRSSVPQHDIEIEHGQHSEDPHESSGSPSDSSSDTPSEPERKTQRVRKIKPPRTVLTHPLYSGSVPFEQETQDMEELGPAAERLELVEEVKPALRSRTPSPLPSPHRPSIEYVPAVSLDESSSGGNVDAPKPPTKGTTSPWPTMAPLAPPEGQQSPARKKRLALPMSSSDILQAPLMDPDSTPIPSVVPSPHRSRRQSLEGSPPSSPHLLSRADMAALPKSPAHDSDLRLRVTRPGSPSQYAMALAPEANSSKLVSRTAGPRSVVSKSVEDVRQPIATMAHTSASGTTPQRMTPGSCTRTISPDFFAAPSPVIAPGSRDLITWKTPSPSGAHGPRGVSNVSVLSDVMSAPIEASPRESTEVPTGVKTPDKKDK